MSRVIHDTFFKQAKSQGYVARSAYKLIEIQTKHKIIPQGGCVLDLGCFPGAWLQVACQSIGPAGKGGRVVGIDLKDMKLPQRFIDSRVAAMHGDARELSEDLLLAMAPKGYDAVISDMCHSTHGNSSLDAAKSIELAEVAWALACGGPVADGGELEGSDGSERRGVLRLGGALVMKLLQGAGTQEFAAELRRDFGKVAWHRPKATRSESKEVYLIGLKRKK